jgi:hypothetical protein
VTQPLRVSVEDDDAVTMVRVSGDLDVDSTAGLRTSFLECLAEQPAAILASLAAMTVSAPAALTVFPAVTRQAAVWPGIPALFCAALPPVAGLLTGADEARVPYYPTEVAARAALGDAIRPPLVVVDELLPVAGAVRHARNMATDACARWNLPHLAGPAGLIANELVANVIDHVGSMMTVRISLRSRQLHVAVRDGSPRVPSLLPARTASGLGLVAAIATDWGCLSMVDGKVVWAELATA